MARKDLFRVGDPSPAPQDAPQSSPPDRPVHRRGAVAAMGRDLQSNTIREIPVDRIVDDSPKDRITVEDEGIEALRESIREHGQQIPILVRPIVQTPGIYRIVYGRRRLAAIRPLGLKARCIIRSLSEEEAILAQGHENSLRRDPSFIERAYFAKHLRELDFNPQLIRDALSSDRAAISRMKSVTDAVPEDLAHLIGPAPDSGRRTWIALAEALTDAPALKTARRAAKAVEPGASSDAILAQVLAAVTRSKAEVARGQRAAPRNLALESGRTIGTVRRDSANLTLKVTLKGNEDFGSWLEARSEEILRQLHGEWKKEAPAH